MALRSLSILFPVAAVIVGAVVACSHQETKLVDVPDDEEDASVSGDSGLGILSFKPADMYSGFDGTHDFKVPFAIYDSDDDVEVTASPASSVTLTPMALTKPVGPSGTDTGKYYFAIPKAAGDITLTVKSGGKTASGILHVMEYDPGLFAIGEARYGTGEMNTDDGTTSPPCTDCHVNGEAIDHSPSALVSVKDDDVGRIITTGLSTGGFPIKLNNPKYPGGHKWATKDPTSGADQKPGLIVYLRALDPKGFK